MVKPITPSEVGKVKADVFPPEVIEAFNELIAQHFSNGSAVISQGDAEALIWEKLRPRHQELELSARRMMVERGWLNVEAMYETAGWKVEYDKPGYNESGSAIYTFRK